MSITRDNRNIIVECDNCHETFETESESFDGALNAMAEEGWHKRKVGNNWYHYCSDQCRDAKR
jgi:hypothetical protein